MRKIVCLPSSMLGIARNPVFTMSSAGINSTGCPVVGKNPSHVTAGTEMVKIHIATPGYKKEHIAVALSGGVLTVKGQIPDVHEGKWKYREFTTGQFENQYIIPDTLDDNGIQAELRDGILQLTLPYKEAEMPRKIEIHNS